MKKKQKQLELDGSRKEQLRDTLLETFDEEELDELLEYKLDKKYKDIAKGISYKQRARNLISTAIREGWLCELICAAYEKRMHNDTLSHFTLLCGKDSNDKYLEKLSLKRYIELIERCPEEKREELTHIINQICHKIAEQLKNPSFESICEKLKEMLKVGARLCGFEEDTVIIFAWGSNQEYEKIGGANFGV
ncbi:MAG: effector-associated domain EAD1-containing protein [Candidatus Hodarchaeota archaeon]